MTLSNVSDWLEVSEKPSQPQLIQDIDEDEDDGMALRVGISGVGVGG